MARITKRDQVLGSVVRGDVSTSLLGARAVDVVNDQAQAIAATNAAPEAVTFENAIRGRSATLFSLKLALARKTRFAFCSVMCWRSLATTKTKALLASAGTFFGQSLCIAIRTLLTLGFAWTRRVFPARMTKPLFDKASITLMIADAYCGQALSTTNMACNDTCVSTCDAEPFLLETDFAGVASPLGFFNATGAARLALPWGGLAAGEAESLFAEAGLPFGLRLAHYLGALWTTHRRECGLTRSTMNTDPLRFPCGASFFGTTHDCLPASV